jgi:protease IV
MKLVKGAWKLLVGVKDALVLLFMLLFFGALYGLLSSSPNPGGGKGGALLLALDGPIVEQAEALDPRELLTGSAPTGSQYKLSDMLQALRAAVEDDAIKTVVLDLDAFSGGGQTSLEDVAGVLDKLRAAKKPVLAFATGYDDASYLLAAHASEIWLDPMGAAYFPGPGGSRPYFKGLIDRLGVNVHVYRVGKFKSFVEPYTRDGQSPEAKAANLALVGAIWSNWQENVSKARPKAQLAAYIANPAAGLAPGGDLSQQALKAGIVDKIGDRTAFNKRVAEIAGSDKDAEIPFRHSKVEDYAAANPASTSGDAIGIIQIAGDIVDGNAPAGTAGGDSIAALVRKAIASEKFKALVVRVDSPGGSALASERIRASILEAKAKGLPVVTSMGSVAASGGYWVAMAGDKVFAEPSTITGSIGVFGIIPTFERTLARYGVTADGVKTTPLSGQPDIISGTNPETDALIQAGVDNIYARFLALVSTARKLPPEKVAEIAQGRVWDGGSARQLGLIDAFGSLDDAVAEAANRAKLDPTDVHSIVIAEEPSWLEGMIGGWFGARSPRTDLFTRFALRQQAALVAGLSDAEALLTGPAIQARCLECQTAPRRTTHSSSSLWAFFSKKIVS